MKYTKNDILAAEEIFYSQFYGITNPVQHKGANGFIYTRDPYRIVLDIYSLPAITCASPANDWLKGFGEGGREINEPMAFYVNRYQTHLRNFGLQKDWLDEMFEKVKPKLSTQIKADDPRLLAYYKKPRTRDFDKEHWDSLLKEKNYQMRKTYPVNNVEKVPIICEKCFRTYFINFNNLVRQKQGCIHCANGGLQFSDYKKLGTPLVQPLPRKHLKAYWILNGYVVRYSYLEMQAFRDSDFSDKTIVEKYINGLK